MFVKYYVTKPAYLNRIAECFDYELQLKPYAYTYSEFKKQRKILKVEEAMEIKKQMCLDKSQFHQIDVDNQKLVSPYLPFYSDKKEKFRKYLENDDLHTCVEDEELIFNRIFHNESSCNLDQEEELKLEDAEEEEEEEEEQENEEENKKVEENEENKIEGLEKGNIPKDNIIKEEVKEAITNKGEEIKLIDTDPKVDNKEIKHEELNDNNIKLSNFSDQNNNIDLEINIKERNLKEKLIESKKVSLEMTGIFLKKIDENNKKEEKNNEEEIKGNDVLKQEEEKKNNNDEFLEKEEKKQEDEEEEIDLNKCRHNCDIYRNLDKLRLTERSIYEVANMNLLKKHPDFNDSFFLRNYFQYQKKVSEK
jgi:hypothetical protein